MHACLEVSLSHVAPRQEVLDLGVDSQFSQGCDMATEYFKMSQFIQKHSTLFMFQDENLFSTLCHQIKECTA